MKWQLLHHACWAGDAAEVARLLAAGANPNQIAPTNWRQSPLGRTLEFRVTHPKHDGHVETVKVLLKAGADPALRSTYLDLTPYELACFCGLAPASGLLREFQTNAPPLWLQAASRLPQELAMTKDVNLPFRHATPLALACGHAGNFTRADELIRAGAKPNAGPSLLDACCDWHFEHLVPAIRYLAEHGWNVNSQALHKAAFLGYSNAIRELLKQGADPGLPDAEDRTPLDIAREARKPAAVKALERVC